MDQPEQRRRHQQPKSEIDAEEPQRAAKRLIHSRLNVAAKEDLLAEAGAKKQPQDRQRHVDNRSVEPHRHDQRNAQNRSEDEQAGGWMQPLKDNPLSPQEQQKQDRVEKFTDRRENRSLQIG